MNGETAPLYAMAATTSSGETVYYYGIEYQGTYYGDFEVAQQEFYDFVLQDGIISTILYNHAPHSVIPTETEETWQVIAFSSTGWGIQNIDVYYDP